jgi:four helix bundle protein
VFSGGTRCARHRRIPEKITSYRDLIAWQKPMDLAELVHRISCRFPPQERFGLAAHFRKTAVAIPSNIAEGTRRRPAGYLQRVVDALAEHAELETQALLAHRLGYVRDNEMRAFEALSGEVGRVTHGLERSIEATLAAAGDRSRP